MAESTNGDGGEAPPLVEERASRLFDESRLILGDRWADGRRDPDRGLRVTVIDLTDDDVVAVRDAATRLGVSDWLRLEPADPAALHAWERLRHELINLQDARPRVLQTSPTPDPGYRRPPVRIHLDAAAETVAADLHARYGGFVALHVGAFPYPPNPDQPRRSRSRPAQRDTVDSTEMRLELDGPLTIRSGQTHTHSLLLTNLSDRVITIETDGNLTADIIAADTGIHVGGFTGWQTQPLVTFTAAPGQTIRIPLLIGTASADPHLGYTVPPGTWMLTAPMDLADGRHLTTPALPFLVTG